MEQGHDIGAQCCAYVKGEKVVDLCGHYKNNNIDRDQYDYNANSL